MTGQQFERSAVDFELATQHSENRLYLSGLHLKASTEHKSKLSLWTNVMVTMQRSVLLDHITSPSRREGVP